MNKIDKMKINLVISNAKSSDEIVEKLKGKYDEDELLNELLEKYNKRTIVASTSLFSKSENLEEIACYFILNGNANYIIKLLCNSSFTSRISKQSLDKLIDICFNNYYDKPQLITLYNERLIDEEYIKNKLSKSYTLALKFIKMIISYNYINTKIVSISYIEDIVLRSNDAKLIYDFAIKCPNADLNKLMDKIINIGDINYIYLFARDINSINKKILIDKILESNNSYYIINTIAYIDISLINIFKSSEEFLQAVSSLDISEASKISLIKQIMSELNKREEKYNDDDIKPKSNKK